MKWLQIMLCGAVLLSSTAYQTGRSPAGLDELLDQAGAIMDEYHKLFVELTTEEKKTLEVYDRSGKLARSREIVSEFIVYRTERDPQQAVEFRNVLRVDGAEVKKREERIEKLFARLARDGSAAKEIERIQHESKRYNIGYDADGYTLHKGVALRKGLRQVFRYDLHGRERIEGREVVVIGFEQTDLKPDFVGVTLPAKLKPSRKRIRGRLWLDSEQAQLWREEVELVFDSAAAPRPLVRMRIEFDYRPGIAGLWLPQRIDFAFYEAAGGGQAETYRSTRTVNEYAEFKRFSVSGREEQIAPPK